MDSGNLNSQDAALLRLTVSLQSDPEQRERPEAFDAPESRCDVEERRGEAALLLVGGAPAIDSPHPLRDKTVQRLQGVRRLQADPQVAEDAEPVQGEGFFQPLVQTGHRRRVQEAQLAAEPEE